MILFIHSVVYKIRPPNSRDSLASHVGCSCGILATRHRLPLSLGVYLPYPCHHLLICLLTCVHIQITQGDHCFTVSQILRILQAAMWLLLLMQRHQESYMRRELQWEATLARLQQQLAQLKGEGNQRAAEDAAEGQAKQLSTIR